MNGSKDAATRRSRLALVLTAGALYFAEGLPFGIVNELGPLYLRQRGASLAAVGALSLISLAWTLKFLWSPLVDRLGAYDRWITGALAAITLALLPLALSSSIPLAVVWVCLTVLAFSSATQDIAVDALTIVAVPPQDFGLVNATRVTTYRAAMIFSGGALAAISSYHGWQVSFALATGVTALLTLFSLTLPRSARGDSTSNVLGSLQRWFRRGDIALIAAIVFLYKLGDAALTPMVKPFWLDRGHSAAEIGTVTTTIGIAFTIAGAWIGGIVLERHGVVPALLALGVAQMLSNVGYALVAQYGAPRGGWYAAAIIESFTGGLGTAAFLTFLMKLSDREHAATDFALLSAGYRLSASFAGMASGFAAERIGYAPYFWVTVAAGVPALVIVFFARERLAANTVS